WLTFLLLQTVGVAQLNAGLADPSQWLTHSGDYSGRRHSPLTQITPANVAELRAAWTFRTGVAGKWEASPLVIAGAVYATVPNNTDWAIDAKTGQQIWRYQREQPLNDLSVCCGPVNRGFAAFTDLLLMTTLDAHLVALDRKTGAVVYDVAIDDWHKGYT